MRGVRLILAVMLLAMVAAAPAHAVFPGANAFPGENGKIAYTWDEVESLSEPSGNAEIGLINPDGSGQTFLTSGPARDARPVWSPDGQKIAFESDRDGNTNIYVMDADGTSETPLTTDPGSDGRPVWSPDATKIAFMSGRDGNPELYVMEADGSNEVRLSNDPRIDGSATWSPDGTRLAFARSDPAPFPPVVDIYTVNVDGSGLTLLTGEASGTQDGQPVWSPDGSKIAFKSRDAASSGSWAIRTMNPDGSTKQFVLSNVDFMEWAPIGNRILFKRGPDAYTANRDGTDVRLVTTFVSHMRSSPDAQHLTVDGKTCADEGVPCDPSQLFVVRSDGSGLTALGHGEESDWQPIPINAYPRPKGASPLQTSLVPAYQPCTSPNRTHGPPLAFPSCASPQRTPGQLTIGTADSNGRPTKSVSIIQIGVRPGIPSTTTVDEADLRLFGTVNDVRLASDLSDYTGNLEARMSLRITDKDNTPHPGGPGAGTTQDLTYSFPIPCSATSDTTVGGDCTFETTAEAFAPGLVKELRRSIWELGSMRVYDGSGGLFMTQGIFVP
jgi:hypothetical protein